MTGENQEIWLFRGYGMSMDELIILARSRRPRIPNYLWKETKDLSLPLDPNDIPDFKEWVNWNGFKNPSHLAYDFACYIDSNDKPILGLPPRIPVRAVADGIVKRIAGGETSGLPYYRFIELEHGKSNNGFISSYTHVIPKAIPNQRVKKGDIIGLLYQNRSIPSDSLVHLHFKLLNGESYNDRIVKKSDRYVDPAKIFPELKRLIASPQAELQFNVKVK